MAEPGAADAAEGARDARAAQWDAVRGRLFASVAGVGPPDALDEAWARFRAATAEAFDRPVPDYPVYRSLRTFAVARWPQLLAVVGGAADAGLDPDALRAPLDEATAVLREACAARERGTVDRLEREMELLRALLDERPAAR